MEKFKIIGEVTTIPKMGNGVHHKGGPKKGGSLFSGIFQKLGDVKPGKFILVEHDANWPSEFHCRLWLEAKRKGFKRGQIKVCVRGKKAYIGLK